MPYNQGFPAWDRDGKTTETHLCEIKALFWHGRHLYLIFIFSKLLPIDCDNPWRSQPGHHHLHFLSAEHGAQGGHVIRIVMEPGEELEPLSSIHGL